jgi:hypothetical protein
MNGYVIGLKFWVTLRGLANLVAFWVQVFLNLLIRGGFELLVLGNGVFLIPSRH